MLEIAKSAESQDNFQHVVDLLNDTKKFFYRIGAVEIEKKVSEMATQICEPLYLVVAGEYNSGKSSFVNAICGKRILKDGPTPSTNKITLLNPVVNFSGIMSQLLTMQKDTLLLYSILSILWPDVAQ